MKEYLKLYLKIINDILRSRRGEMKTGEFIETAVIIGKTVYTARAFFKPTGMALSEKIMRNMEKELDNDNGVCYNKVKSQNSLDCKQKPLNGRKGA